MLQKLLWEYRQRKKLPLSYCLEGEDLIVNRLFRDQAQGFYVDVGARHPVMWSNTYLLYKRGWRGINIDAMPGSMTLFDRVRPRDINLELGIAERPGELLFHIFEEDPLNTFDPKLAKRRVDMGMTLLKEVPVACKPLSAVFKEFVKWPIDLLSIDVEGFDLQVLQSADLQEYRPRTIIVEDTSRELELSPISAFMHDNGYKLHAKTQSNSVFVLVADKPVRPYTGHEH